MVLQFIVNLTVVTLVTREFCQEVTEENPRESTEKEDKNTIELMIEEELVTKKTGQEVKGKNQSVTEDKKQSKPFFALKAAVTAMWLPAVVGDKKNLLIAASISTLISKILMLLMSSILAYFFQEKIHSHPFILWSRVGKIPDC